MPLLDKVCYDKLVALGRSKDSRNVILTSEPGIGKTTIAIEIMHLLKYEPVLYLSCATIDPWVDFVGIPVPDKVKNSIRFCQRQDVQDAKSIILDEINRTHEKTQNAMLEIVQYGSINGVKLKHCKALWALQNPATGKHHVKELDQAMIGRFKARVTLLANPSSDYYQKVGIPEEVADTLVQWWKEDLSEEQQQIVQPRTLEYLGYLIRDRLDWKFSMGESLGVPTYPLEQRLATNCGISKFEGLTLEKITEEMEAEEGITKYTKLAKEDDDFNTHFSRELEKSKPVHCWDAADIVMNLKAEFRNKMFFNQKWTQKMMQEYPLLHSSFHKSAAVRDLATEIKTATGLAVSEEE